MTEQRSDYLWDPAAPPDPQVAALEATLRGYGAHARGLHLRPPVPARRWRARRFGLRAAAGLAAAALIVLVAGHVFRLSWPQDAPWPVQLTDPGGAAAASELDVGDVLATGPGQRAQLRVARIGDLSLAPDSRVRLLETRSGAHRIAMEHGRLHARIWAPPGHFAVAGGGSLFIDFGCEFELALAPSGSGSLRVLSGWVQHDTGAREVLVPAGHAIAFTAGTTATPVRDAAPAALRRAVEALDQALDGNGDPARIDVLAHEVANAADDADVHTLLSLLTRHPPLAGTPLYPRLARVLGTPADGTAHRAAWQRGERRAIDRWWEQVPMPPKNWLAHWRDAL